MTGSQVRSAWIELRAHLADQAQTMKMSQSAVLELSRRYVQLAPDERLEVDQLMGEWVLSSDETKRFDALALIADHRIESAVPALRMLSEQLEASEAPSAPYEWAKVNRVLGKLTSTDRA